jgi:hypothetical protein
MLADLPLSLAVDLGVWQRSWDVTTYQIVKIFGFSALWCACSGRPRTAKPADIGLESTLYVRFQPVWRAGGKVVMLVEES